MLASFSINKLNMIPTLNMTMNMNCEAEHRANVVMTSLCLRFLPQVQLFRTSKQLRISSAPVYLVLFSETVSFPISYEVMAGDFFVKVPVEIRAFSLSQQMQFSWLRSTEPECRPADA